MAQMFGQVSIRSVAIGDFVSSYMYVSSGVESKPMNTESQFCPREDTPIELRLSKYQIQLIVFVNIVEIFD